MLGAGHGGLAMAGHLSILGFDVTLWNRSPERVEHVTLRGGIEVEGEVEGFGTPRLSTADIRRAVRGVDVLMVVVPAFAHAGLAKSLARVLRDGQIVVLNPGRTGGALEFAHVLKRERCRARVLIAEAQTLIYVARHLEPTRAHIFQIKNEIPLAALPAYRTPEVLKAVRKAFPQFVAGGSVLQTSLDNIGSLFHPAVMVLNAARVESTHGDFEYYLEGITPSVARVLDQMDGERMEVAAELGIRAHRAKDWLYQAYASAGGSLYEAIQVTPGYKGVRAPSMLTHRYILEDVPMSLVPIASLGEHLGVELPTTRAIIHLASLMTGQDFWKTGRTVERMGLSGMSLREIRALAAEGVR
ncbi:MAG TPA: NAD/NADP octopine/nopaline dehydrogenase family protein [Thermoplasmata archaeon]|nr:NAD/NADP octopine/nopaline dehydrogenase family protein [Thermoplasmata archaeon]